jgi:3-hydroxyisobutyrate dehydrogenase
VNVGFVGLGRMGTPMARALLRAGFPLTVFNRTSRRALLLGDARASQGDGADLAAVAQALRAAAPAVSAVRS